ncbi:N-acetyltransferase [Azospirillum sp. RWY-5-1]|uniref:N-acetyltransferase n=1 Tax=Azospirillum oleiclasticum TaxID=2735135 RepID=A0ABX2T779_9PROT|nr:GNAT family N-acetyltransferase [Azospirillum oleiclasticum]NYZ11623.1 N-acetyltransferase [Azospirillum oleiclasticum]NYZ18784.1 N-acetyltransferase [Azospirillum oleiclasticum]
MPDAGGAISVKVLTGIAEVEPAAWDACAGGDNPFLCHAFLLALEESGSVGGRSGWQPAHLVAETPDGRVVGAVPLYAKGHSYGEYVFDHSWANAYERAGGRYYPKLQVAVPFTPVPGPRLLVPPGDGAVPVRHALVRAMEEVARRFDVSSVHVTFPTEPEWRLLGEEGWLQRTGVQYHWDNHGYATFDDFLGALNARKRKAIRKERREVAESGVRLHTLTGDELKQEHWDAFHRFYMDTADRKWGGGYLKRSFFHRIGATMADRVVLVMCEDGGEWVAGALNLLGTDTLYGRNWGSDGRYRFLHFEACYYRALDFAIAHGLKRVEAGAQGEHKIQRGYLPVRTYSAHWVRDPGFREVLDRHLAGERLAVEDELCAIADMSPYRQGDDSSQ